jgi:hypothetical protein
MPTSAYDRARNLPGTCHLPFFPPLPRTTVTARFFFCLLNRALASQSDAAAAHLLKQASGENDLIMTLNLVSPPGDN